MRGIERERERERARGGNKRLKDYCSASRKFLVRTVDVPLSERLGVVTAKRREKQQKKKKLHFLKKLKRLRARSSFAGKETSQQRMTANWKTSYLNLDSTSSEIDCPKSQSILKRAATINCWEMMGKYASYFENNS